MFNNLLIRDLLRKSQRTCVVVSRGFVEGQPKQPFVKTAIPGPKSRKIMKKLNKIYPAKTTHFIADYECSIGNYIFDVDGNRILDLYMQNGSLALGYNHPSLFDIFCEDKNLHAIVNRPSLGIFPPSDWAESLKCALMENAPPDMVQVYTMMCGTCAVDSAIKCMFMAFKHRERGGDMEFEKEAQSSAMVNMAPGCPVISILSLMGGSHGHTMACKISSHFTYKTKIDFPTLKWPTAELPKYKYPLECYKCENELADREAADAVDCIMRKKAKRCEPVAGIIVETIQSDGEHNMISRNFLRRLQTVGKKYHATFCIDEVDTGVGASGSMWDHTHYKLVDPPDIVVFGKKAQATGIFCSKVLVHHPLRVFNTWMGDPGKLLVAEKTFSTIHKCGLVQNAKVIGCKFMERLEELCEQYKPLICSPRGRGLLIGFSCCKKEVRDAIHCMLLQTGVLVGKSGEFSIRLRPALIVQEKHADIFYCALQRVLRDISGG